MLSAPHNRFRPAALFAWLATFALFAPAIRGGFFPIDDQEYVLDFPAVQAGLRPAAVREALATAVEGHYTPLVTLSFMSDTSLFGTAPWGYHVTNVLLHACNALLLFCLFRRWTGGNSVALPLLAALLWAWHPLRVEAVAWIASRKDVLSGFFLILCLWCWTSGGGRPSWLRYWAAWAFFSCGILSKAVLVMVPPLLLVLDSWPLRRFDGRARTFGRLVLEKLPFFAVSLAAGLLLFRTNHVFGSLDPAAAPLCKRLAMVPSNYLFSLEKIFWPSRLCVIPAVPVRWSAFRFAAALLTGVGLLAWAAGIRRRHPAVPAGALWFLLLLLPVIGIVHAGVTRGYADRFTYHAAMGLSVALLALPPRRGVHALLAAVALCCAVLSLRQVPFWHGEDGCLRQLLRPAEPPPFNVRFASRLCLGRKDFAAARDIGAAALPRGMGDALPAVLLAYVAEGRPEEAAAVFRGFTGQDASEFPIEGIRSLPSGFAAELAAALAYLGNARGEWGRALPLWAESFRQTDLAPLDDRPWTDFLRPFLFGEWIRACIETGDEGEAARLERERLREFPGTLPLQRPEQFAAWDVGIASEGFAGYALLQLEGEIERFPGDAAIPLHAANLLLSTPAGRLPALDDRARAAKALAWARRAAAAAPCETVFLRATLAGAEKRARDCALPEALPPPAGPGDD